MVYHGRSKGCVPCKKRRKKCDQTRPSCLRCIRSNRVCTGYEDSAHQAFKQYTVNNHPNHTHNVNSNVNGYSPPTFESRARKCSLPRRSFIPGTDVLVADIDSEGIAVSTQEVREFALRAFYYDFCVLPPGWERSDSPSSSGSRGYLSSVERMVAKLGDESMLARACRAVGWITHGQVLRRPQVIENADMAYREVVGDLALAIEASGGTVSAEAKLVSMLLGLYELSKPDFTSSNRHGTHARGLGALLGTGDSPLSLLNGASSCSVSDRRKNTSIGNNRALFSTPGSPDQAIVLDNLLLHLDMLWSRYETPSPGYDPSTLRDDCHALETRFKNWESSQVEESQPTPVGTIRGKAGTEEVAVGCWPGPVDTYSDFYVAGVWNIARAAQLLLLILMMQLSENECDHSELAKRAKITVEGIIASAPYHLTDNLYQFLDGPQTEIEDPGRTLGGFLMIHPLYIASQAPSIPVSMRDYLKRCLEWISSDMGVGYAGKLAQSQGVDNDSLRSACMIIWTGFLA